MKIRSGYRPSSALKLLQRLASLHRETLRLCPVFFEDKLILRGEGPEDVLHRIDALLPRA